jgi:hexosaminidase
MLRCTFLAFLLFLADRGRLLAQEIIPKPQQLVTSEGSFPLGQDTRIVAPGEARALGGRLGDILRPATGLALSVTERGGAGAIHLILDAGRGSLGEEGYRLVVRTDRVEIRASRPAGLFYGVQTLRQLLPKEVFREAVVKGVQWRLPIVTIEDAPRFSWRGSHLDAGRYFIPKGFIKRHLDLMALHKLNVLHWHLTEDQGWRLEIKKYPRLTTVGAWRRETAIPQLGYGRAILGPGQPRDSQMMRFDNTPHGGFYSQDDVREIVQFAADRFITVVPEIEMPGHSTAAIAAYPELGNFPEHRVEVATDDVIATTVFNTEDGTLEFLKDVLTEVMGLFPSTFIHIGGDECPKSEWARSPRALARMIREGLVAPETLLADIQSHVDESGKPSPHPALAKLQSWFIHEMDAFITSKGRRLIGWDEILEGGLAPGAAVMSWRGEEGGIAAAQAGHDAVMAPGEFTYFNRYQALPPSPEPFGREGYLPLSTVYGYDPIPKALTPGQSQHVLGAQGQLWTNFISSTQHAEYMLWPRLAALAEVLWSPTAGRDFGEFQTRLRAHLERLDALDVNYRPLEGPRGYAQFGDRSLAH